MINFFVLFLSLFRDQFLITVNVNYNIILIKACAAYLRDRIYYNTTPLFLSQSSFEINNTAFVFEHH